ncbi:hypothetical protein [Delftia sp. PS-11]|uniref:hypothetical protein n=1 Tax=Delftia sp. PS-11 TaxID=2767222 RepID=UPI0024544B88|nr:hypothetical protein [Delftia sp. PS-11]KAJ8745474.1 hypothetical protein H9T68_06675 [Delftia sp. PS-11]
MHSPFAKKGPSGIQPLPVLSLRQAAHGSALACDLQPLHLRLIALLQRQVHQSTLIPVKNRQETFIVLNLKATSVTQGK